jgi:hypothetical protein
MRRPFLATAVLVAGACLPLLAEEPEIRYVSFSVATEQLPADGGQTTATLSVTDTTGAAASLRDDVALAAISGDLHLTIVGGPTTLPAGQSTAQYQVQALPGLPAGSVVPVTIHLGQMGAAGAEVVVGTPNGGG